MPSIECVPNISEGRRVHVVDAVVAAILAVPRVQVLDVASDAAHNRTVIAMVGEAGPLHHAVLAIYSAALRLIDLRSHRGEHPRMGAVDVVPFIPLGETTMVECIDVARDTARAVASRFDIPVFLYEEAATAPARHNVADIRRGQFEGLSEKLAQPAWAPDFGPARPHPSAGASAIGARMPLIPFNVNLATDRVDVARTIAAAVRYSSGGLPFVKAIGVSLADRGIVQVSMNLTNYRETPPRRAFEAVRVEAERHGVSILESEIIGIVPEAAVAGVDPVEMKLARFSPAQVLESRLSR